MNGEPRRGSAAGRSLGAAASRVVLVLLLAWPSTAAAYVGPGAGLSLLGSLWWLLVAVLTAIGVVLYWPVKVLIRWLRFQLRVRRAATAASRDADDDPPAAEPRR